MEHLKGFILLSFFIATSAVGHSIFDESRDRHIPVEVSYPDNKENCLTSSKCPVAFISAGYGISHTKYTFITKILNELGFLSVSIGHELPNDPPLSVSGNLYETRSENWQRGAKTLAVLSNKLGSQYLNYDFKKLTLIGHSNGGDISAWIGNELVSGLNQENEMWIERIITLDHRRVPLPKSQMIQVLSIRASDFPADPGVLPTEQEQQQFGSCVVTIPDAKHNDMFDGGPDGLKQTITSLIALSVNGHTCERLQQK